MTRWLKVVAPIVVVAVGAIAAAALVASREKPRTVIPEPVAPLVRVHRVELRDLRLSVTSQGTVSPRTESALVPEVSGRVIEVAPSFESGGFFEQGDVLLRIDPYDYRQAVVQTEAQVAQAELRLEQEQAEAKLAREEWEAIGEGDPTPLTLRRPQVAQAEAALAAARAALEKARRDLERTELRAPYAGRVRSKTVDVGQFVTRGAPVASIYAVDYAEVRLPLPDDELAFVRLPLTYRGSDDASESGPPVILRARFAGDVHEWHGRIVRTEGEIDRTSRMVHTVARVKDPYGRGDDPDRPPLAAGMFVQAEILGEEVSAVALIPRAAVRDDGRVLVVDDEDRLRFREVQILRSQGNEVVVRSGLADGDRVCVSPLTAVTDGMRVRTDTSGEEQG